jgi:hypothetical protein
MTYWDWIRMLNVVVLLVMVATLVVRYRAGVRMLDPRDLLDDPSHLPLLRVGLILMYVALIEGNLEGLLRGLPGGPRILALLPGLLLVLLSMHWGRARRAWLRLRGPRRPRQAPDSLRPSPRTTPTNFDNQRTI